MKALLGTISDFGTQRVFRARAFPVQREELPCAIVFTLDEPARRANLARTLERDLALVIAIKAKGPEDEVEDELDRLAVLVEQAMAPKTLGIQGIMDSTLERTTTSIDGQSQLPIGSLALVYRVTYRTPAGAPDAFA